MSKVAEVFDSLEYGPAPEAIGQANTWLDDHGRAFGHFIKGEWTDASAGPSFDVANPATRETIARVGQASDALVAEAVAAARAAQAGWWALGPHGRARYLHAIARRIQKHARLFAVLETMDNGKPIRESRDLDIPLVARHFYHHAGWAQLMPDEFPNSEPVGVIGQIIPWNFPLLMMAWKIAPALAMGNTLVLKPAEFTPLSALLFAQLCEEVGLPRGVVNIITGDGATGAAIVAHDDVDKIAFTGSTDVGRIIREATAGSGKRLSLELGGKSPFLVFEDADLDSVVEGVVDAIWFNQGQVCCAGSRILIQEGVAAELERKLRARMETLRMGNPLDKAVDMGAIVAPVQLARIESLVEQGRSEGAQVWQPSWSPPREGWFYPPTLCTNVAPSSTLAQIEVFGPVAVLMTFRTPAEAVELANDTRYGLAASLWSENINLALDVAPKIKAGTVWVNCTNLFDAAAGFGGYRESGYGREGGEEGLHEYMMPTWERDAPELQSLPPTDGSPAAAVEGIPPVDRTAKLYVGGKQSRPDGDSSVAVYGHDGSFLGEVGRGNRKDVRNAVEAASEAQAGWASRTAHNRAQVLYYFAENLQVRRAEFIDGLAAFSGDTDDASAEFDASIERLFVYAAWADKWEGRVHHTPLRNVTLAMKEPMGVIGITAPAERPLLGLISGIAPAIAVGNSVVVLPSERASLVATDLYQVMDTSDVPAGVINIVTGPHAETLPTLAAHDTVDCMWHFGSQEDSKTVEAASTGNLKRTWVSYGRARDWFDAHQGYGEEFLREATQVKNIWVPYGA
ncbi:MAG: aldehyde dehydrogenase family protein [Longimicrobiales bacterium]|nr:aldehyde dehydrogenase family protein [Longimicrobiales bacterium]